MATETLQHNHTLVSSAVPDDGFALSLWEPEYHAIIWPFVIYWVVGLTYHVIAKLNIPFFEQYRTQPINEEQANNPELSVKRVVFRVFLQQILQSFMVLLVIFFERVVNKKNPYDFVAPAWYVRAGQFVLAMFVLDAYQYWVHRGAHEIKWAYRQFHSTHHRLLMPYAFGALYNHPVESFLLDAVSGALSIAVVGLADDIVVGTAFVCFATLKTVDDHCGYNFPWDPLQRFFPNNNWFHDVHHQRPGLKFNYSQPFFTYWDKLCGTYVDADDFHAWIDHRDSTSPDKRMTMKQFLEHRKKK